MRKAAALFVLALLAACSGDVKPTAFLEEFSSAGEPAPGFINPGVANAYLPMQGRKFYFDHSYGAGVVIAPGIAVTAGHNADFVEPENAVGASHAYDLFFFHNAAGAPPPMGKPFLSEEVIAYGSGDDGSLRMARGRVVSLDALAQNHQCPSCGDQHALVFEANGGFRFSGGPVVDATDGKLLGIVFGFVDDKPHGRLMYAYDMDRVFQELATVQGRVPAR